MSKGASTEQVVRENHLLGTRRRFSAEEKVRIVLEGLRGEETVAERCRREGLACRPGDTSTAAPASTTKTTSTPSLGGTSGGCVRSGCSGQVCDDHGVATSCEWQPWYACYDSTRCERQADGSCRWTLTPELTACLLPAGGPGVG
jgi:eight-cysteine-cluster-containing protein